MPRAWAPFTEPPNTPTGWLGTKGAADISELIPAYRASDLEDDHHTILNNHDFNALQNKLVLYCYVHYELESLKI